LCALVGNKRVSRNIWFANINISEKAEEKLYFYLIYQNVLNPESPTLMILILVLIHMYISWFADTSIHVC